MIEQVDAMEYQTFLTAMATQAAILPGRPAPDDAKITALLPDFDDITLIAFIDDQPRGAIWSKAYQPPLLGDLDATEIDMAVQSAYRNKGLGSQLLQAMIAVEQNLVLNVHLLNPAARLYVRNGFRVVGHGRGRYGVAMRYHTT